MKKGAVASVFEGYPSYIMAAPTRVRGDGSSRKRPLQLGCDNDRTANKCRKSAATGNINNTRPVDSTAESADDSVADAHMQSTVVPSCGSPIDASSSHPMSYTVRKKQSIAECTAAAGKDTSAIFFEAPALRRPAFATQTERSRTASSGLVSWIAGNREPKREPFSYRL